MRLGTLHQGVRMGLRKGKEVDDEQPLGRKETSIALGQPILKREPGFRVRRAVNVPLLRVVRRPAMPQI